MWLDINKANRALKQDRGRSKNFKEGAIENTHFMDGGAGEITKDVRRRKMNKHHGACEGPCILCQGWSRGVRGGAGLQLRRVCPEMRMESEAGSDLGRRRARLWSLGLYAVGWWEGTGVF